MLSPIEGGMCVGVESLINMIDMFDFYKALTCIIYMHNKFITS